MAGRMERPARRGLVTARQRIERAFHVSFKLPEQARQLLDDHEDQVITKCATAMREHAEALPDGDHRIPGLLDAASVLLAARRGSQ